MSDFNRKFENDMKATRNHSIVFLKDYVNSQTIKERKGKGWWTMIAYVLNGHAIKKGVHYKPHGYFWIRKLNKLGKVFQ